MDRAKSKELTNIKFSLSAYIATIAGIEEMMEAIVKYIRFLPLAIWI
jgi:hypothetical protein